MAATAQSVRLTLQEIELQAELGQLLWGAPRTADELAAAVANHRWVVDAIESRDGALARRITEAQIADATVRLIDLHVSLMRQGGAGLAAPPSAGRRSFPAAGAGS